MNLLYERQSNKKATSEEMALVLGHYAKRWTSWCNAGVDGLGFVLFCTSSAKTE